MNVFGCDMCKYKCTKTSNLDVHFLTKKHLEMAKQQNALQISVKYSGGEAVGVENSGERSFKELRSPEDVVNPQFSGETQSRTKMRSIPSTSSPEYKLFTESIGRSKLSEFTTTQKEFYCETCKFRCDKSTYYTRHLNTKKHINKTQLKRSNSYELNSYELRSPEFPRTPSAARPEYFTTSEKIATHSESTGVSQELLIQLVQQNKELSNLLLEERQKNKEQYAELLEYCKEPKHITNQNNFNLNFFLNVTCKDALNMSDFIRDLEIQIEDVESVSKLGFVEGITQIVVNRLKGLEQHQRPIHCTDVKRDVLYIKDDNRWEKDVENHKIKHVIETVEQRNCRKVCCDMKPELFHEDEHRMEKYMSLLREVNGAGAREKNHEKIVKNLAKTFVIAKEPGGEAVGFQRT
jgi:hypothetical protein